ncbi:FAD-linked oxidase [Lampropedia cohaerens]|uniref:FAD-linked oxidase n=1 Tax=Lampropedia cohaerens TaxID=1610491 RepID=A0A0U1Q1H0_9BURK|nr:FAD-binding oxidoreductase [Lampropedia cohaerens]KKW68596.1 FAD-linked oxidase [Lampropedia cohaerens]
MNTHTDFLAALQGAVGADAVLRGESIPAACQSDWSGTPPVRPLALVRPASIDEACAVLRLCHAHHIPVVPQGGLTGLAGAAVPHAGGIALSLQRMAAIEAVDPRSGTLQAQAGATLQSIQQAAEQAGLRFGVDLGARGSCQIGGNVATNAGGNGVLQFGMMREQVLGLEVVLADGTVLPMLRPMLKNNTGYDLKHFFIGAEGTLGLITRVLLRLHPRPAARTTLLAAFSAFEQALALLQRLQGAFPARVAAFELMWERFVTCALRWQGGASPFAQTYPLLALIDIEGDADAPLQEAVQEQLALALEAQEVADAVLAQSQAQARQLWRMREAPAEFPTQLHPPINFDVSLPLPEIGRFAAQCQQRLDERWPGHATLYFGHVGDGNLHITTDGASVHHEEAALEAEVYALVEAFGGSVSAEHGIGLHKKPYLRASRSPQEIAAMRAIKQALDPLHLMNPGKVFN